MKKAEEVAFCMYEIHRLFLTNKSIEYPEWEDLTDALKTYWFALAEGAIEMMTEPDSDMINAAIKEYRKPTAVESGATWEQQRAAEFVRVFSASIEAAKVEWKTLARR